MTWRWTCRHESIATITDTWDRGGCGRLRGYPFHFGRDARVHRTARPSSQPHFLSPDGRNVFVHSTGEVTFFWSRDTGPVPIELPDNPAYVRSGVGSASADGRVLMGGGVIGRELPSGALHVDARVGFRWDAINGFTELAELAGGPRTTLVRNITADGRVIVGDSESDVGIEAVRWINEGQTHEPLGYLGISSVYRNVSTPQSSSADGGVIVGSSSRSDGKTQAFRWTESSGMTQLDTSPFPSD